MINYLVSDEQQCRSTIDETSFDINAFVFFETSGEQIDTKRERRGKAENEDEYNEEEEEEKKKNTERKERTNNERCVYMYH